MNNAPVVIVWLTICTTEPDRPMLVSAKTPSMMTPIWEMDE